MDLTISPYVIPNITIISITIIATNIIVTNIVTIQCDHLILASRGCHFCDARWFCALQALQPLAPSDSESLKAGLKIAWSSTQRF